MAPHSETMDQSDSEQSYDEGLTMISDDPTPRTSTAGGIITPSLLFSTIENAIAHHSIVQFFYEGGAKAKREEAKAVVAKLNRVRSRRLFGALLPLVRRVVEEESYCHGDDDDEDDEENNRDDEEITSSLQFLHLTATLLTSHIDSLKSKTAIDECFEIALLLHDLLFPLHSSPSKHASKASSAIYNLCEKWWHADLADREQLVTQLIPLLLLSCLEPNATKSDVKRLHGMREALNLLDFGDPSIESMEKQLLRTLSNPLFLRCGEGRKFLSHLFTVDAELVGRLHGAARVQIPECKRSVLNAYADVYWMAWKSAASEASEEEDGEPFARVSMEENAIQDLANLVIHAANPSVSKNCRIVLDKFLLNKKDPSVESMLYRCFGPILWRSLTASNARVRIQASKVLGDTFPLRDVESKVTYDVVMKKTTEAIVKLMRDEVPSVRVAGCVCAERILGGFWVAVPSGDIRILLNEIIAKHASDTTSSNVRTTAIQTVTSLLSEEKTHAVLRPLLPSLGNLIHDKTEKVRLSVVRMLLVVKKLKGMKYYHVVPAKHLLARLAEEGRGRNNPTGPVAKGLTELLSNSFFPTGDKKTAADVIGRTFKLLQDNPESAVVFYKNASTQLSVHSIVKLISALMKCLCFLIVEEKKGMEEDVSRLELSQVVEEEGLDCSGDDNLEALGVGRMAIIAESISILWESIESGLKNADNEEVNKMLLEAFSGNILTEIFCHFETKFDDSSLRALVAILNCAGKLNEDSIDGLRAHIVGELEMSWNMSAEERSKANFSPYASLLCAWGMAEAVGRCIASSISYYFTDGGEEQPRKKRGKKTEMVLPVLHIDVCINILGYILHGGHSSIVAARESILNCEIAFDAIITALKHVQEVAISRSIGPPALDINDAAIIRIGKCIECHGRLLLHKQSVSDEFSTTLCTEATSLMSWVSESVVPSLIKLIGQDNTLRDLDISGISGIDSPMNSPDVVIPRRRSSRNSSLPRMSLGLSDTTEVPERGSFNVYQDQLKFACSITTAVSSMRSVLLMLSEWLSICHANDKSIISNLTIWCQVLKRFDKMVCKALLPVFCRLALLCLKNCEDSALFDEVLACVEDDAMAAEEEETLSSFIACCFMSVQDEKSSNTFVASIVRAICLSHQKYELDGGELKISRGIKAVLIALLTDSRGSLQLAQYLVNDANSISLRSYLFEEIAHHAPQTVALKKILQKWSNDHATVVDGNAIVSVGNEESQVEVDLQEESAVACS